MTTFTLLGWIFPLRRFLFQGLRAWKCYIEVLPLLASFLFSIFSRARDCIFRTIKNIYIFAPFKYT